MSDPTAAKSATTEQDVAVALFDRLGRRGKLTITVEDGNFDVRLVTRGPYGHMAWCPSDKADWWGHVRLGATDWHGDGPDLGRLLTECEEASRPPWWDVDDLRAAIDRRRETRTHGPALPSYRRWHGWRPAVGERWLRASSHATEYLAGYLRDVEEERQFNAEARARELRRSGRAS